MSRLPTGEPQPSPETQRFWDGTGEDRVDLPRCERCRLVIYPPRASCPDCQSTGLTWETMSGRGTVYSFTVTMAGGGKRWRDHLPFVVAYVQLDEGPTIMTNLVDVDPDTVEIDMAVTAVFDDTGHGNAIVRFTPA